MRSYRLSAEAYKNGLIKDELVEVRIPQKKGKYKKNASVFSIKN